MNHFNFFRGNRFILSGTGHKVPFDTPIGILKGFVDYNLSYNELVPYRVIVRGITFESEVALMTPKEYRKLWLQHNRPYLEDGTPVTQYIKLCAIHLEESQIPNRRVYEVWNGIGINSQPLPNEVLVDRDKVFHIEFIKITRNEYL